MPEASRSAADEVPRVNTLVVLLPPEGLDTDADMSRLFSTLGTARGPIRLLVPVADERALGVAEALAEKGVPLEAILAPELPSPRAAILFVRLTPGPATEALALALSDIVLTVPNPRAPASLLDQARRLEKKIVLLGESLPKLPHVASVTSGLDPCQQGWRARGRTYFGRLEQALLELIAFDWLPWRQNGAASRQRLRQCASGKGWPPAPNFGPKHWPDLTPDLAARKPSAPIVAAFEALDRSALHGSYIHRDLIWVVHFAAAFAVLFAVAGAVWPGFRLVFASAELVALLVVVVLIQAARGFQLQDRWTACRLGAEQLRIAMMCLPLLAVPPALSTVLKPPAGHGGKQKDFTGDVLAEVKRAVRDHGLPRLAPDLSPVQGARWLALIVRDQARYHHLNYHKLEQAESGLRAMSLGIFGAAMVAVVAEFVGECPGLLLMTAAFPAFAAALHGAETRLGIVHRVALSREMEQELGVIRKDLLRTRKALRKAPPADPWASLRSLAKDAAKAMGRENHSWHGLVRRQRDDLPA